MDPRYRRAVVFAVVGVALLANPLYLYPDGVSYETRYTYEATPTDRIPHAAALEVQIEECRFGSRECYVARDMASGDPVEVSVEDSEAVAADLHDEDRYVAVEGGYYEPVARTEEGSLVLSLDPVSEETVRATAATDVEDARPYVRWAIENGSVNVTDDRVPYEARTYFVDHDGTYFLVDPVRSERVPTGWGWKAPPDVAIDAMRLLAWVAGVALLWRAGEWSERGRQAQREQARDATRDDRVR